jgi:hypothetical protein
VCSTPIFELEPSFEIVADMLSRVVYVGKKNKNSHCLHNPSTAGYDRVLHLSKLRSKKNNSFVMETVVSRERLFLNTVLGHPAFSDEGRSKTAWFQEPGTYIFHFHLPVNIYNANIRPFLQTEYAKWIRKNRQEETNPPQYIQCPQLPDALIHVQYPKESVITPEYSINNNNNNSNNLPSMKDSLCKLLGPSPIPMKRTTHVMSKIRYKRINNACSEHKRKHQRCPLDCPRRKLEQECVQRKNATTEARQSAKNVLDSLLLLNPIQTPNVPMETTIGDIASKYRIDPISSNGLVARSNSSIDNRPKDDIKSLVSKFFSFNAL